MYAVIRSGGKQYTVKKGDVIRVERLDAPEGGKLSLAEVLMIADGEDVKVGTPKVAGAKVDAEVRAHGRGPKIKIVKHRRRKHYHKEAGHRQAYTELAITGISSK